MGRLDPRFGQDHLYPGRNHVAGNDHYQRHIRQSRYAQRERSHRDQNVISPDQEAWLLRIVGARFDRQHRNTTTPAPHSQTVTSRSSNSRPTNGRLPTRQQKIKPQPHVLPFGCTYGEDERSRSMLQKICRGAKSLLCREKKPVCGICLIELGKEEKENKEDPPKLDEYKYTRVLVFEEASQKQTGIWSTI